MTFQTTHYTIVAVNVAQRVALTAQGEALPILWLVDAEGAATEQDSAAVYAIAGHPDLCVSIPLDDFAPAAGNA